jgi:hypothetical protein
MTIPIKLRINALGEFEPNDAVPIEHGGTGTSTLLDAQNALGITDKLDRSEYIQHFKGIFVSYAALSAAFPTASDGDYAHIDSGANFDRMVAIWDSSDNKWVINQANTGANTDEVPEGSQNLYFKSQRVLETVLTGLGSGANTEILSTDNLIEAFQKLQAQIKSFEGGSSSEIEWLKANQVGTLHEQFQPYATIGAKRVDLEFAKINGMLYARGAFTCLSKLTGSTNLLLFNDDFKVTAYSWGNSANFTVYWNIYLRSNFTIENALVVYSDGQILDASQASTTFQTLRYYFSDDNVGQVGAWAIGGMGNIICLGVLIKP